jgi:hypothetical protein
MKDAIFRENQPNPNQTPAQTNKEEQLKKK